MAVIIDPISLQYEVPGGLGSPYFFSCDSVAALGIENQSTISSCHEIHCVPPNTLLAESHGAS
jgi:hypothetical protein